MLLIQRLIAGQVVEHKNLQFSTLTGSSISGHLFQRLRDHHGRRGRKILRVRGGI